MKSIPVRLVKAAIVGAVTAGTMTAVAPFVAVKETVRAFTAVPMLPFKAAVYPWKVGIETVTVTVRAYRSGGEPRPDAGAPEGGADG